MKFCSVSQKLSMGNCEKLVGKKRINSFLLLKRANASMRLMYQSIPSITILPSSNPQGNFWSNPRGWGFPKTPYFDKFYTFSPFSRPYSLMQVSISSITISLPRAPLKICTKNLPPHWRQTS